MINHIQTVQNVQPMHNLELLYFDIRSQFY